VSITYNGRLEVRLRKTPAHICRGLEARGFWWDGRARCWWLARPVGVRFPKPGGAPTFQDGWAWAMEFCRQYCGASTVELDAVWAQREAEK